MLAGIEESAGRYDTARDLLAGILDDVAETQSAEQLAEVRVEPVGLQAVYDRFHKSA